MLDLGKHKTSICESKPGHRTKLQVLVALNVINHVFVPVLTSERNISTSVAWFACPDI
jgi:hypothetical protein